MEINKTYWIVINVGGNKALTFTARITKIDNNFVSFIERTGRLLTYNLNSVISFEEVLK